MEYRGALYSEYENSHGGREVKDLDVTATATWFVPLQTLKIHSAYNQNDINIKTHSSIHSYRGEILKCAIYKARSSKPSYFANTGRRLWKSVTSLFQIEVWDVCDIYGDRKWKSLC